MKRLTEYKPRDNSMFPYQLRDDVLSVELDAIHKLGQLEDAEEELGCNLVKVVKALTEGCWIRHGGFCVCYLDGEPQFFEPSRLSIGLTDYYERDSEYDYDSEKKDDCLCIFTILYDNIDCIARLSDYGKTWALSKEELTNE